MVFQPVDVHLEVLRSTLDRDEYSTSCEEAGPEAVPVALLAERNVVPAAAARGAAGQEDMYCGEPRRGRPRHYRWAGPASNL